ncbi:hypothetical protein [Exiguobacterium undae]|uniref:hypothetical protein n=1 Tax=Exiguobacterium undae TaxID=169177 RepID=UPI00047A077B|nr:hypothetical protein [Exiguobacterium undae]
MKQSTIINRRKSALKRRISLINLTNDINFKRCIATNHAIDRFIERINPKACRITADHAIQAAFKNAKYVGRHHNEKGDPSRVYRNGALIMRLAPVENVVLTVYSD